VRDCTRRTPGRLYGGRVDEIEADIEETTDHLEAAESKLETAGSQVNDEEWGPCLNTVEGFRSDVTAARQTSGDALELAREEDHDDHVEALELIQEYVGLLADMADELELLCEAGRQGEDGEVEQRWESLRELDEERKAKRVEASDAVDQL